MKPVVIRCRDLKNGQEQVHAFAYSPVIIGRAKDSDVRLDIDHVSNFHAQIDADDESVGFTDLDSSNGSVINGVARRNQRVPIVSDTRIQIGAFLLSISRELPPGVPARRRIPKKEDTTGGGARQDRTNVLDFDAKEALRSLPGAIRPREPAPAPPAPVVKLEPISAPKVLPAPWAPPSAGQTKTATLEQAPSHVVSQPGATTPSAEQSPSQLPANTNSQLAMEGAVETETGPRRIGVPLVVLTGLLLGGALGLLLFWMLFS